jgi:hypothetical protein
MLKHLSQQDIIDICAIVGERDALGDIPFNPMILIKPPTELERQAHKISLRLADRIEQLSKDAKAELTALVWLGRDDNTEDDFESFLAAAKRMSNAGISGYLADKRPLHNYLQEGLRIIRG